MNKFNITRLVLLVIISLCLNNCKEVFEDDLSKVTVNVLAPSDNTVTTTLTHTFWWDPVENARGYNITIVSKSFDNIETLVLDSNITTNKFTYTLYPDTFQWSVMAYNGSSNTDYMISDLIIAQSSDLSEQMVVLKSPSNNSYQNGDTVDLQWFELSNADYYMVEVRTPDWDGSPVISPQTASTTSFALSGIDDGTYYWGVKAINESSSTNFSIRSFILDTQDPNNPVITYPTYNAAIHDSTLTDSKITVLWNRGVETGSEISDSIYISQDSLFTSSETFYSTATSYEYELASAGIYWIKLISIDLAGNKSEYTIGKFVYNTLKNKNAFYK